MRTALFFLAGSLLLGPGRAGADYVHFETPQVHPLHLSPDGRVLAACNTADGRVELFDATLDPPAPLGAIPVGIDPVTARFRTSTELWVVNQISDSVSVIDLERRAVVRTLQTLDEPADVVFAGEPQRAFVSCSQANTVQVFDPSDLEAPPQSVPVEGEDPRALAVSPDGLTVYAAIFESGNGTTILGGGADLEEDTLAFPPNVVSDPRGPYGGLNPPPNHGDSFLPAPHPGNPAPPAVGLIVRRHADGRWRDDNGGDWTDFVSGPLAPSSGRPVGWELIDHDVAAIDTGTREVRYLEGCMNLCMSLAAHPASGALAVVGTDATNEIRFEPVLNGRFLRVQLAVAEPGAATPSRVVDLNPHLDYQSHTAPPDVRTRSLGDPRGIAWHPDGSRAFITGQGSNNVVIVGPDGNRLEPQEGIPVGEGPTGLAVDAARGRLHVLNHFAGSLSTIDLDTGTETARQPFFDPTPQAVRAGRKHLFDTHRTSGLGHVACASCHVDARMDRLAWDLGDPAGEMIPLDEHNLGGGLPALGDGATDFHPMKGPMTTQTMQDIIGKEPHHWRGDRAGIEAFNPAFPNLMGADGPLTAEEMQEFEDYLATLHFPPNPFRGIDNSLPQSLPLPGHYATGRFGQAGDPLPPGNAQRALTELYRPLARGIDRAVFACVTCHTLPTGAGTDTSISLAGFTPIPAGPNGERHHALVSVDGSVQKSIKIAQLRNLYDKAGFNTIRNRSLAGFGYLHDGSVDSLERFLSEEAFDVQTDQEVADLVALMLAFSGSDYGPRTEFLEPPGTPSQDAHAAAGRQVTLANGEDNADLALGRLLLSLADGGAVGVVARATPGAAPRGWTYLGGDRWQADAARQEAATADLLALADAGVPVTLTAVPAGCQERLGTDRDRDALLDFDERRDLVPALAGVQNPFDPADEDRTGNDGSTAPDGVPDGENDFDGDGASNADEFRAGTNPVDNLLPLLPPQRLTIERDPGDGSVALEWNGLPATVYQVQYSADQTGWTDSPAGRVETGDAPRRLRWIDSGPPATDPGPREAPERFYRVLRLP